MMNLAVKRLLKNLKSVASNIHRSKVTRIERTSPPVNFRQENEVQAAYDQIGETPNRRTKSWYGDIYDFYQNNEC